MEQLVVRDCHVFGDVPPTTVSQAGQQVNGQLAKVTQLANETGRLEADRPSVLGVGEMTGLEVAEVFVVVVVVVDMTNIMINEHLFSTKIFLDGSKSVGKCPNVSK